MKFISEHKAMFGVGPICRVLTGHGCAIAPLTYYEVIARDRPRAVRDEQLKHQITQVREQNYCLVVKQRLTDPSSVTVRFQPRDRLLESADPPTAAGTG